MKKGIVRRLVRPEIGAAAKSIARVFRPDAIILFGSHAQGLARPDSDVDLLIVARTTRPLDLAGRIHESLEARFPADIVVRTPREVERALREEDPFLCEILRKGCRLYEARRTRVG